MTHTGRDSSTEEKELAGIAIPCDGDIDDKLRDIIEDFASILTQSNPFNDLAEVDNDNASSKSQISMDIRL